MQTLTLTFADGSTQTCSVLGIGEDSISVQSKTAFSPEGPAHVETGTGQIEVRVTSVPNIFAHEAAISGPEILKVIKFLSE